MASIRSLLARWLGGAGVPASGGIRSFLARWLGGAGNAATPPDLECGGAADVARTRTHEASGGSVFDGSAVVNKISAAQEIIRGGLFFQAPPKPKPEPKRKRSVRQTYRYVADGGLELAASAAVLGSRSILASGGSTVSVSTTVERTRALDPSPGFIHGGIADVESYDAIYDTEDEEIVSLLAFAA